MPDPQNQPALDFSSIPGHQIHDPSTISAAKPDTLGLGIQDLDPVHLAMDIGPALDHLTSHIENYTQSGRALHPVLSRLGDATRAAKELLVGGTTPKGPQEGVLNNPVTTAMSMGDVAPEAAEALADRRAFAANPEAGHIKLDFDSVKGHEIDPAPNTTKEIVHIAPKDFINKVTQSKIYPDTVNHYRKLIRAGEDVGPASIHYDADGNIIGANGNHRAVAHLQEGTERMPVEIHRPAPEVKSAPEVHPAQKAIEDAGMVYKGELTPGSHVHMFEDPAHPGKTVAMNEATNITPDTVKEKMANKLKEFGVKPNPAGAGSMVSKALPQ